MAKEIINTKFFIVALLLAASCQKELPDGFGNYVVNKGGQGQATVSPEITLDTNSLEFTAESGSKSFNVKSNMAWTVSSYMDWCTVSPTSGSNNGSVTVRVNENTSTKSRTATITVRSESSKVGHLMVKVTQDASNDSISLDIDIIGFSSSRGETTFKITSNTSWTVSSNQRWCTVNPSSGSGDGRVTVSVEENYSTSDREATITVESKSIKRTLGVWQSGAEPPVSQDRTFTVGGVTFKMIYVEGGTFTMGATSEQGDDVSDSQKPAHSVTLSSYCIGETEVTQALWQAVMGSNPSYFSGSNRPVESVSWDDCRDFISKLNAKTGESFRLPTEAEWEFAARGGNMSRGYKYAGSNTLGDVAWYSNNSSGQTHNVAIKQTNELGLYDMSGNVHEWCSDFWGSYTSSSQTNPTGPASGGTFNSHIIRSGSWSSDENVCRVAYRNGFPPDNQSITRGLRLAL